MADPFEVFGRLCANEVLKSLEPKHLAICCTVSRSWLSLAGEDHLWREHTEVGGFQPLVSNPSFS